jgi:trehalose 6-phosphate phosphatase
VTIGRASLGRRREDLLSTPETQTPDRLHRIAAPLQLPWCLFLDVDGTLLDISPTPDAVRVDATLLELMITAERALCGAVALVSGRPIETLDELFAPLRWPMAGLHGLERRDATGGLHVSGPVDARLGAARHALQALAAATPGTLLEDKGRTLALHYRAVPEREYELRRAMQSLATELGEQYQLLEGKRVLELKPAHASKADAIRAFLAEPPFAGRRPLFIGDDVTDLDGFAAVERVGGLSVAVGDRVEAQVRVASPRDVRALLADLIEGRLVGR